MAHLLACSRWPDTPRPAGRRRRAAADLPEEGRDSRQEPGPRRSHIPPLGEQKKETPRNKCLRGKWWLGNKAMAGKQNFGRRPYVAPRDPRIKSKIPHSRRFSRGVKWSLKLMKPFQSCLREMWKVHWCELSLWKPYNLFTWQQVSFHIPLSTCSCDSHGAERGQTSSWVFLYARRIVTQLEAIYSITNFSIASI